MRSARRADGPSTSCSSRCATGSTASNRPRPRAGRGGPLLVDTRPGEQRDRDGEVPGAVVVDRNVLEWRLDPASPYRIPEVTGYDLEVIVLCNEGYSSSLVADTLRTLGLRRAVDVVGGFEAWAALGCPSRGSAHGHRGLTPCLLLKTAWAHRTPLGCAPSVALGSRPGPRSRFRAGSGARSRSRPRCSATVWPGHRRSCSSPGLAARRRLVARSADPRPSYLRTVDVGLG